MDKKNIKGKFGSNYYANETTYKMGIDIRFSDHLALRFEDLIVLETCSGGGFTLISLAKYAKHVYSFEIDKNRYNDAKKNIKIAGVESKVTIKNIDIYKALQTKSIYNVEASFIDPDWADSEPNHIYKFINSNTKPPSDHLFKQIFEITPNITLVQPPFINLDEFTDLPRHELECLYINNTLELYCLHFGTLAELYGKSEFRVNI